MVTGGVFVVAVAVKQGAIANVFINYYFIIPSGPVQVPLICGKQMVVLHTSPSIARSAFFWSQFFPVECYSGTAWIGSAFSAITDLFLAGCFLILRKSVDSLPIYSFIGLEINGAPGISKGPAMSPDFIPFTLP